MSDLHSARRAAARVLGFNNNTGEVGRRAFAGWLVASFLLGAIFMAVLGGVKFQGVVGDGDNVQLISDNVSVIQSSAQEYLDFGQAPDAVRKSIREQVFAFFPQVMGKSDSFTWKTVQTFIRDHDHVNVDNVRDILRYVRDGDIPRQIATLLRHYEGALAYVSVENAGELTPRWKTLAANDNGARKKQWKEIVLNNVRDRYGEPWMNFVEVELKI